MTDRTVDAADWIARQPKAMQEAGEARGQDLIRDATLREVRDAVKRTQIEVAAAMGTSQDRVSKLERSDDALVSTLPPPRARAGWRTEADGRIPGPSRYGHRPERLPTRGEECSGPAVIVL